ncbi:hypothetical protein A2943_01520 [Candidatus Adlerbacteria bacterium RIFCSPLOWO2_01_FULL_51_16]|uniref:Glycosyltransferase subfamily 4-like N-terminal domain-containing protein n=1 Tax=Candidatus Adlerbacteria bacterium RIFCSPLOWO2_01_FULL_51_16 TaxID=1797243 RepID=A0A1F4XIJ3_9BACT|nr:MAG: hypothetical protein A2943_01520 [Candidatus Adlerbacteria bacterium RIFCSPLOWO2_01_FULL_51_16]
MKKILFVITKANWGGAQRYVFDLATSLPKEEFEVVVVYGTPGLLVEKLKRAGIMIYHNISLGRDISVGKDAKSFFELYRLFKKEKPNIVHLNSSKAGGVGALAARLARIPKVIFTVHGLPWDESRNVVSKFLIYLASQVTFLLCHKVITVSQDNHKRVRGSTLIYNGIGPIVFGSGEKIRSAYPAGVKIMGTIGELNKNKNQKTLVEQAKNDLHMYVAIVGEGEERENLENLIKKYSLGDRVKLFGFIPASEVLRGFDTFALPSLKEGLPYVLLEAKIAGLPIVASRVGGVSEILDTNDMSKFSLEAMLQKTMELYNRG